MRTKLPYSRITSATSPISEQNVGQKRNEAVNNNKSGVTGLVNAQDITLPLKFGKQRYRKETQINMHSETAQNPERSCIRTYSKAYQSRVFEDQMHFSNQSDILNKRPEYIFNNKNYISLQKPGECSHLKYESRDFPNDSRKGKVERIPNGNNLLNSRVEFGNNPITVGQVNTKHNSTLSNTWKEERRQRDNGVNCSNALQWNTKIARREPYQPNFLKKAKSYKQLHLSKNQGQ